MLKNIAAQSSTWSDELVLDALQCVSKHEAGFAALGCICSTPGTGNAQSTPGPLRRHGPTRWDLQGRIASRPSSFVASNQR
jgi:hypothetical protein